MIKKLQALKAKKGFTLVELIVVIAIIGVLAAILVPTMMGMVTKSRVTSLDQTASSLKDTVSTWMMELDAEGGKVAANATITVTVDAGKVEAKAAGLDGTGTASFLRKDGKTDAMKLLQDTITKDYNFGNKAAIAKIHIKDRKVIGAWYAEDKSFTAGPTSADLIKATFKFTGDTDGLMSDGTIVGTAPKCTKAIS